MISEWRDKNADRRKSHFVCLFDVAGGACAGVAGGWSCNTMAGLACARASYASQAMDGELAASMMLWIVCVDSYRQVTETTITCTQDCKVWCVVPGLHVKVSLVALQFGFGARRQLPFPASRAPIVSTTANDLMAVACSPIWAACEQTTHQSSLPQTTPMSIFISPHRLIMAADDSSSELPDISAPASRVRTYPRTRNLPALKLSTLR